MKIHFTNHNFKATVPHTRASSTLGFVINYHECKNYEKMLLNALNEMLPDDKDSVTFTKCEYNKDTKSWKWGCKIKCNGIGKKLFPKRTIRMSDDGYIKACQVADSIANVVKKMTGKEYLYYPSLG